MRITTQDFEPDYLAGDTGTVESGPHPIPSGGVFYVVRMERDGPGAAAIIVREDDMEVVATVEAIP
jgi:hypothetical protein